jgi:hypothetical protein
MFLGLICAAFGLFAPTVLMPILHEYCELLAEETRLAGRVAELDREIRRRGELANAFAHDTLINERLAMLDLGYRRPNEVVLPVLPGNYAAAASRAYEPVTAPGRLSLPGHWPQWAREVEHWADQKGLIGLFLDSSLRPVFLLMSGGLVVAAFVLFAPTTVGRPSRSSRPASGAELVAAQPAG